MGDIHRVGFNVVKAKLYEIALQTHTKPSYCIAKASCNFFTIINYNDVHSLLLVEDKHRLMTSL